MVGVDVTKENFKAVLPAVLEALDSCAFFAIDCEMTGLQTDAARPDFLDDMQARYSKLADSSRSYIITQYGLSCFTPTGPNAYEARSFNFYAFPRPHGSHCRRFLCDAGSLTFLADHGFDFNTCIRHGVSYLPVRTRDWQLAQATRAFEPRNPVVVSSPEDKAFVEALSELVGSWLAGKPLGEAGLHLSSGSSEDEPMLPGAGSSDEDAGAAAAAAAAMAQADRLVLAPLNSYRRLLAFQELRKPRGTFDGSSSTDEDNKHPGFWVTKGADTRCLVLVRATAAQAAAYEAADRAARVEGIHEAAGLAAVFDAMRASGKPCVGHNCMLDVAYSLFSFGDAHLPATWTDYKALAASWHPGGLWDTKYLAKRLPEVFGGQTALAEVFAATSQPGGAQAAAMQPLLDAASAAAGRRLALPQVSHAPGWDKYRGLAAGEAAHEAGYDAFMTGAVFAALLPLVAGKVAFDPASELAAAAAAAAAAPSAAGAGAEAAAAAGADSPGSSPAEQQQQPPDGAGGSSAASHVTAQLLAAAAGVRGRLNLTYSDIPFAALWGDDPIPERPTTHHVTGLAPGWRTDDVMRLLRQAGLAHGARVTPVDSCSCLVTLTPELAPAAATALADLNVGLVVTSWADYAAARQQQQQPGKGLEAAAAAAAAAGPDGAAGADAAAVVAKAAAAITGGAPSSKRRRLATEDADVPGSEQQEPAPSRCSIM